MIPGVLVAVFLFVGRASAQAALVAADAQKLLSEIAANFIIDPLNPPTSDTSANPAWEDTCAHLWFSCWRIGKYDQLFLDSGTISPYYRVNEDVSPYINFGQNNSTITATTSTTVTDSTTAGWTVGAKLSVGGALGEGLPTMTGEISASYSSETTSSSSNVTTVTHTNICEPGFECRLETWTYHVKVSGQCKVNRWFACDGPGNSEFGNVNQCTYPIKGCQQLDDYANLCTTVPTTPCEISTPVLGADGKPYSTVVFIQTTPGNESMKRSELDQPQPKYQVIG